MDGLLKQTIIISGALANKPFNGGNAWSRLSWVSGFRKLGFEVCFIEQIDSKIAINGGAVPYFRSIMDEFGLSQSAALIDGNGETLHGLSTAEFCRRAMHSALLLNISGHLAHEEIKSLARCKVYFDDDPGFTQFWQAAGAAGAKLDGHDYYFTIGANIGRPGCVIPSNGIRWRHTCTPVVLQDWPVSRPQHFDRFTTVASWRGSYGPVQYAGKTYGVKAHEFRKVIELPRLSRSKFEIALQIHPGDRKDREALLACGWQLTEPKPATGSTSAFRRYVQMSGAEFSVAQGVYVDTQSGWFSDRTVRYLASGRPALVQDTGFSRHYPVGEGLLAFRTLEEAIEGAERITREYDKHCIAARRLAEEFFDSDKVIRRLASETGWSAA
jgi:hypothetical protein